MFDGFGFLREHVKRKGETRCSRSYYLRTVRYAFNSFNFVTRKMLKLPSKKSNLVNTHFMDS